MKSVEELRYDYLRQSKHWPNSHPIYPMDEAGIYLVYGEDPNPDWGGHHIEPFLGVYEGTFDNVLTAAVTHPRFWCWGAGGRIVKAEVNHA